VFRFSRSARKTEHQDRVSTLLPQAKPAVAARQRSLRGGRCRTNDQSIHDLYALTARQHDQRIDVDRRDCVAQLPP
jgi:hypothetical protein